MSQTIEPVAGFAPSTSIDAVGHNALTSFGPAGQVMIADPSGSVVIKIEPAGLGDDGDDDFDDNLAEILPADVLSNVASQLVEDVAQDEMSRSGWVEQFEEGLHLLGLQMKTNRGEAGYSVGKVDGMATVVAPLLLSEVLRAQATARGELLPASGPVKVENESARSTQPDMLLSNALQRDMNTYLTRVCTEYYPDTDRMLFYAVFCGSGFKKVYRCPLRRRPLSESVDAKDLIVNAGATDLANAQRITHVIQMRRSMLKRMQLVGAYRRVELTSPAPETRQLDEAQANVAGLRARSELPHDLNYTLYEILTEWDFGEGPDGLPLPYRITVDRDSRTILDIRRNWRPDDHLYRAKEMYVRYPYIDAISFYGIGLLHLLGNTSRALTGAMRMLLDAGMFSNFPGFLISDAASRQDTNELRVAPGAGRKVNTGGRPIKDMVMNLPYKEPSTVLLALCEALRKDAQLMAGSAEIPTDSGKSPIPVGTMLAMIEQATKPTSAVHKRMHAAQAKEFQLLVDLLREDPEAFWLHGRRGISAWDKQTFVEALDKFELVPVSDPNSPTRTHRLLKAQALKMLQEGNPQLYDAKAVDSLILRLLGFSNPDEFFNHEPPGPNPMAMEAQAKLHESQEKIAAQNRATQAKLTGDIIKAHTAVALQEEKSELERAKLGLDARRLGAETAAEGMKGVRENHTELQPPPLKLPDVKKPKDDAK